MASQADSKLPLEVLGVSGTRVFTWRHPGNLRVLRLKEMLSPRLETPEAFLELVHEEIVLQDQEVLSLSAVEPKTLIAIRKEPPTLFEYLKSFITARFARRFGSRRAHLDWRRATERVVQYILASDRDGKVVNQKEEVWDDRYDDFDEYRDCTALHYAARFGETFICKALLDHRLFHQANSVADIAMPHSYSSVMEFDGKQCTALHAAVAWYKPDICSLLLHHSRFSAVASKNDGGQTALHMAVVTCEIDLVAQLLEDGRIDLGARTRGGLTAVELAMLTRVEKSFDSRCRGKYDNILALLLARSPVSDSVNVLSLAIATFDKALEQVALSCLRRRGKFLAGAHVGNGRLDTSQLFRNDFACKEDRCRKKFIQKQKEFCRKQNVAAKLLRKSKCSHDEMPVRRPPQLRMKTARAWGVLDWQIYR